MSAASIVPEFDDDDEITPGTWVKVIGQVVKSPHHPEDTVVEFFSHNEQWRGYVREDRVTVIDPPSFAIPCSRLYEYKASRYVKCALTDGHPGDHQSGDRTWSESQVAGYFEDNS